MRQHGSATECSAPLQVNSAPNKAEIYITRASRRALVPENSQRRKNSASHIRCSMDGRAGRITLKVAYAQTPLPSAQTQTHA